MHLLLFVVFCIAAAFADDLRNHLFGFEGCVDGQDDLIIDAWRDARGVMDLLRTLRIDWNEQAAVDYLGQPEYTTDRQGDIQAILNNLGTITEATSSNWKLHVRYDDWLTPGYELLSSFFRDGTVPLSTIIQTAKTATNPRYKYQMDIYHNTIAGLILHELLYVDWVHMSGKYGTNRQVVDWTIEIRDLENPKITKRVPVYGPTYAKILAHTYCPGCLGDFIARSDDNLMLHAMAKYVQQELEIYPHRPLWNEQSPRSRPWMPWPMNWIDWFLGAKYNQDMTLALPDGTSDLVDKLFGDGKHSIKTSDNSTSSDV